MSTSQNNPSELSEQLKHTTQEMYKKNLELAERNKTLSLLRKIDEIILGAVTDVQQIAQQVANSVVTEAGCKGLFIFLTDNKEAILTSLVVSLAKANEEIGDDLQRALYEMKISFEEKDNLLVKIAREKKMYKTDNLYVIFKPHLSEEACIKIQTIIGMNSFFIYPLVIRQEVTGLIIISLGDQEQDIFPYQSDLIDRLPEVVAIAIDNALLYKKIEEANLKLKELDQLKSEFVSIASHELRTPMTAIKSYLWMVLNKSTQPLDSKLKDYIKIAYNSTERLISLVKDMLTVSRIEGNRYELHMEKCNLYELLKQIYDELVIAATEKKINLILNQPKEDFFVNVDSEKIKEVFINLIGNSLKFTPESGSITISIAKKDSILRVSISDTGPGISQEDIPKLFHKFNRLDHSYTQTHNVTGTGLGLYISKQIITLHDGDIGVESELGKGSVFTISIPEYNSGKTNYGTDTATPKEEDPSSGR